jgi:hypothetical protein
VRSRIDSVREFCEENNLRLHEDIRGGDLKPGDFYVAKRNTGPHLFECRTVDERGWVYPVGPGYPYDFYECYKVDLV